MLVWLVLRYSPWVQAEHLTGGQRSQDGALSLVCGVWSLCPQGPSPPMWFVKTRGFCTGWCRAG